MKKFLIHFMSVDAPSVEDDGIAAGTGFGIHNKVFDSKEEAEKGLEELMLEDKAELEECFGFNEEEEDWEPSVEIEIEDGSYGRKQLTVYDGCNEINTTIYEIVEMEF